MQAAESLNNLDRLFAFPVLICLEGWLFLLRMRQEVETSVLELTEVQTKTTSPYQIIVWNDDVNTFEWVIETLMEVCGHTHEQAEQCAYIIHFSGKYAVKSGTYEDLRPMVDAILDRGISATLEVTA